jgi:cytochrome c553
MKRGLGFLLSALLLPSAAAWLGGWATISVEDLPDYAVAGQPLEMAFTVRSHGNAGVTGLEPTVEARSGKRRVTARATATAGAGRYAFRLALPEPGDWSVNIHSGMGPFQLSLLPIRAIAPGSPPPAPLTDAERGKHLFVAKGCVGCHVHRAANDRAMVNIGPELTHRRFDRAYLESWLKDPAATRAPSPGSEQMPNMHLKPREIASLVAFINAERAAASKPAR